MLLDDMGDTFADETSCLLAEAMGEWVEVVDTEQGDAQELECAEILSQWVVKDTFKMLSVGESCHGVVGEFVLEFLVDFAQELAVTINQVSFRKHQCYQFYWQTLLS